MWYQYNGTTLERFAVLVHTDFSDYKTTGTLY